MGAQSSPATPSEEGEQQIQEDGVKDNPPAEIKVHFTLNTSQVNPLTQPSSLINEQLHKLIIQSDSRKVAKFKGMALQPSQINDWASTYQLSLNNPNERHYLIGGVVLRYAMDIGLDDTTALNITSYLTLIDKQVLFDELIDEDKRSAIIHLTNNLINSNYVFLNVTTHHVEFLIQHLGKQERDDTLGSILYAQLTNLEPKQPHTTIMEITQTLLAQQNGALLNLIDNHNSLKTATTMIINELTITTNPNQATKDSQPTLSPEHPKIHNPYNGTLAPYHRELEKIFSLGWQAIKGIPPPPDPPNSGKPAQALQGLWGG